MLFSLSACGLPTDPTGDVCTDRSFLTGKHLLSQQQADGLCMNDSKPSMVGTREYFVVTKYNSDHQVDWFLCSHHQNVDAYECAYMGTGQDAGDISFRQHEKDTLQP